MNHTDVLPNRYQPQSQDFRNALVQNLKAKIKIECFASNLGPLKYKEIPSVPKDFIE